MMPLWQNWNRFRKKQSNSKMIVTWFAQFFWRAARRHENRPAKRLQKFAQQWVSVPGSKLDGVGIAFASGVPWAKPDLRQINRLTTTETEAKLEPSAPEGQSSSPLESVQLRLGPTTVCSGRVRAKRACSPSLAERPSLKYLKTSIFHLMRWKFFWKSLKGLWTCFLSYQAAKPRYSRNQCVGHY